MLFFYNNFVHNCVFLLKNLCILIFCCTFAVEFVKREKRQSFSESRFFFFMCLLLLDSIGCIFRFSY